MASDDLRARIAEVLNCAPSKLLNGRPESLAFHLERLDQPVLSSRHDRHTYMATCALCRGEADTLADAVLAVVQPELEQQRALNDAAWGSVWLHGRWSWLTKNMTTPEREYAADCVARWSAALNADDPNLEPGEPEGLRWWREPEPEPCTCRGLPLPLGQTCNAHQIKETRHDA